VTVWTEERAGLIRVHVKDNGIGIAAEHRRRVFNLFERLHGGEKYPGTGIGLAIVEKAVERLGGCIGLESEIGKGSCFWIDLPKHCPR
jgi:signal transduction histidine kinase